MKRLAAVTVWILAGGALTGGVYWAFLITPESTVGALLLSALLAVIALVLLAITVNGAVAAWSMGPSRESFKTSITGTPTIVPAVAIVGVVWWLTGRVTTWVTAHSGEINAWFIAQFGWDDISALFTGITWGANWIRWVVGPLLSLSLIASLLVGGWQSATRLSCNLNVASAKGPILPNCGKGPERALRQAGARILNSVAATCGFLGYERYCVKRLKGILYPRISTGMFRG